MRIRIIKYLLFVAIGLLSLWLLFLQVISGSNYKSLSNRNSIRLLSQPGARGRILDRNGVVIVDSKLIYDLMLVKENTRDFERSLLKAAEVMAVSEESLRRSFRKGYSASFAPVVVMRNIDTRKAIALEELRMDYPAIVIQARPQRDYPHGKIAAHLLGYLNEIDHWRLTKLADYGYKTKDVVGYTGIEEKYDYFLREEEGALSVEVDHRGKFMRVLGFKPPQRGKDLQLTLDLRIQKISEASLEGHRGSVVILDPYTGEIITLASAPTYDPAVFSGGRSNEVTSLFNDPDKSLTNRAISGSYAPGSVFKLAVAYAGLEQKKINLSSAWVCQGGMYVGKRRFRCWDTHNRQDLIASIAHSCDVFFYHTGLLLGAQSIHDYAQKFGFGRLTGIDIPYEVAGFIPDPRWKQIIRLQKWYDGDTANFSIGQGDLLVTPLQTARMMCSFINQGYLIRPYLLRSVEGKDYSLHQRRIVKLQLKDKYLKSVVEGARKVVSEVSGTAHILSTINTPVAGKTGTAEVARRSSHGWFVGYFPVEVPRYVICVFLEHGGSGMSASIVTRSIIEAMEREGLV